MGGHLIFFDMSFKNIAFFSLLLLLTTACSEEQKLKRKIDGTYSIKTFTTTHTVLPGCSGQNFTSFAVENPGTMVFTGKKTIDGPPASAGSRPYYGYLDYDVATTNHLGQAVVIEDRTYFQYEVLDGEGGGGDTTFAFIFFNGVKYNLEVVFDGNNIAAFQYRLPSGDPCYRVVESHLVK